MIDTTFFIQLLSVVLFAGSFFHSWRTEGPRAAQQWFFIGFIYALLLISLLVVSGQIAYNPGLLAIGAAPSLIVMLYPALFYIAYTVARRFVEPTRLRAMGYLVFAITPWLTLPIDALAVPLLWWSFPSDSYSFLNGIPFYIPFAWGLAGAGYAIMMGRIRKIRFRGNGQFFAMIIAAPLLAGILILLIAVVQLVVDGLAAIGGDTLLYIALAILYVLLPLALIFNIPRLISRQAAVTPRNIKRR